ncbi:MAG: sulfatase [Planctomycetota bacterium]
MNRWNPLGLLLVALCVLPGLRGHADATTERPNFVVIVADDLGWRDPGFMGSDYHRTPHLDRLASEGLIFERAYANASVCAPTRAAILSGMYGTRTGVYTVGRGATDQNALPLITPTHQSSLSAEIVTLPEALQQAGYATGHIGKWHLGRATGSTGPLAHGFDTTVGASRGGGTRTYFAPYGIATLDADATSGEYLTHRLTDEAIDFVNDHRDEPFLLWLAHYAVHTPIETEPEVLAEVQQRPRGQLHSHPEYAAMVESLDTSVGRLLDAIEEAGLGENTVIVFVSDNGGGHRVTSMAPLSGSKGSLYEGGIRVPCVVKFPGVVPVGSRTEQPVMLMDLFPTLLELAGTPLPKDQPVDGESWVRLLGDPTHRLEERTLAWYVPVYSTGPRGNINKRPSAVITRGRWKLMHDFETDTSKLYDLQRDPSETQDLASAQPAALARMQRELRDWLNTTDAILPQPNPDYTGQAANPPRERRRNRRQP